MTIARAMSSTQFSPRLLFDGGGTNGAWWDPSDITTLFQDSAGTTAVTADGDPVGLVKDKSGNGRDLTASSTARPTYKVSGSLAYLSFNGSSNVMTASGTASTMKFLHSDVSTFCFGGKFQNSSDPQVGAGLFGTNTGSSSKIGACFYYYDDATINNSARQFITNGGTPAVVNNINNNTLTPNTEHVLTVFGDPTNGTAANRGTIYIDNGSALQSNSITGTRSTSNSSYDLQVGAYGNNVSPSLIYVYGLIMINATISEYNRQQLQRWMASKSGVIF